MDLIIDTGNGIAGDIVAAGLIGLGADAATVAGAMERAGNLMGRASVRHRVDGGVHRLEVILDEKPGHVHAGMARELLSSALAGAEEPWRSMGFRVLEALIEAEGHVHGHHPALRGHFHGGETVLHEASDIILDIAGMAAGMQALDIRKVAFPGPVNVGSGTVTFSHGTLEVPTPATRRILESHGIPWERSASGMETATPTGAAILAGCGAEMVRELPRGCRRALAGGTRPLPPVEFILG